jgi:hypothetical protein
MKWGKVQVCTVVISAHVGNEGADNSVFLRRAEVCSVGFGVSVYYMSRE